MKVLISDNISKVCVDILKKAGLEVDIKTGLPADELRKIIGEYSGLVIRSATKVTADIIDAATNLKVVGRAGSGLDNVDKAAASKKGIVVMNTPGGNTVTTAEHTIAMMFAAARKIAQANASLAAGKWEKKKFMGIELFNKTLGIIGLGKIGGEVAKRAQGLGMQVIAYDPFLSEERAAEMGIAKGEIAEIMNRSDFITVHTPLTAETKNLFNAESITTCKKGVVLINCARGGIINEKALLEALNNGQVGAAALDVFEVEPPVDNPLVGHEKVVCTPHLGASTEEAQENVAVAVAEQIVDYLVKGTIRNAINFPSIPADQVATLQPWINLAELMGSFTCQLFEDGITEALIEYRGDVTALNTQPITIAAIKGLLNPILLETVNFVNAPFIAKERGIEIKEMKAKDSGDYQALIVLKVKSPKKSISVEGTLFSKKDPRIVRIDTHTVEILPEGHMLVMQNNDKPGVIGNIGSTLGNAGINIARMHFGRESAGGKALSVVNIDSPTNDAVLEQIRKLPNILLVKAISV
ncbi:MAG TPA: phosphoglycerate dehydrogenase [Dissulfurispiraceae bacterium]|nr:phosphoglycerate dehydrogenase [Dissulfurispiraceae bacterium]